MKINEFINKYKPCKEAAEWLRSLPENYTMKTAWEECERSDWLMWLLKRLPPEQKPDKTSFVRVAVAFAKRALPIYEKSRPNDKRPAEAIAAAERWITEPTEENRAAASCAAASCAATSCAAASCAAAYAAASDCAAYAAASDCAAAAAASDCAAAASDCAAYAADASCAAASCAVAVAYDAAKKAERKAQAEIIRGIVKNPFGRKRKTVPVEVEEKR
jgi:hypothetical protein